MSTENHRAAWVLRRLQEIQGLQVRRGPYGSIIIRVHDGHPIPFYLIEERLISEERARALVSQFKQNKSDRPLFATERLTPEARQTLRGGGLSWLEKESGHSHLIGPGLLIDIDRGRLSDSRRKPQLRPASLLRGRSGLVAEALLTNQARVEFKLGEITKKTGLSRGLVSRVVARLTQLEILQVNGQGPRKFWNLRDASALLDRWSEEEYPKPEEASGLSVWTRTPAELLARIRRLNEARVRHAIGGVAAANLYEPSLSVTPIPAIWISAEVSPLKVAACLGGEIVGSGANLWTWQTGGDPALKFSVEVPAMDRNVGTLWVVSRPRAYLEARRSGGRGADAAAMLRRTLNLTPSPSGS